MMNNANTLSEITILLFHLNSTNTQILVGILHQILATKSAEESLVGLIDGNLTLKGYA